jgi:hypothetical protein
VTALAGLLAANAVLLALGAGALLLTGTWDRLRPWSRIAPSLLAGFALAATVLPPLVYCGIAPTPIVAIAIASVVLAAGAVRRQRPRPPVDASGSGFAVFVVAALAGVPLIVRAATEPLTKFDAYADWTLKAKILYGHGGLLTGALDRQSLSAYYSASHREYPLGLPSIEALDFHFMGSADSQLIHLQSVLLAAAFCGTVWALLRPRVQPAILAVSLLLLLVAPSLHTDLLAAYADAPIACLWAASALAFGLWLLDDGDDRLWLGALLAAGALAIKQEGIVLDASLLLVVGGALVVRGGRRDLRRFALALGAIVLTGLPWQIWVRTHDLHDADIAPSASRMVQRAHTVPTIVHRLGAELVWLRWPGIVGVAVLASLILIVARRDLLAAGYVLLLGLSMSGIVVVYWNARIPIGPLLTQSAERVVTAPVLLSFAVLPLLLERLGEVGSPVRARRRAYGV